MRAGRGRAGRQRGALPGKIDRSFIAAIDGPASEAPVTKAIVSLGRALGMAVIAEGVETDAQRHYLRALGCQAAQGYLLGHPQPAAAIDELLDAADPAPAGRPASARRAAPRPHGGAARAATPTGRAGGRDAPIPPDDAARLAALRSCDVLDSEP